MKLFLKIVFFILLLLFWLPMLQQISNYCKEAKLNGAFVSPIEPTFHIDSVKSGVFQKRVEDYQNFQMGFRGNFIKLKNSVEYILFKKLNADDIMEGKEGYIYSISSVDFSTGRWQADKQKVAETVQKIKFLQQCVENKGGLFLTLFAPAKEAVYPEYLPYNYNYVYTDNVFFTTYINEYKKNNIPFIDFCSYFREIKNSQKYPLFTKTGFHWSVYGAALAQDSIINYIQQRLDYEMPHYILNSTEIRNEPESSDIDFEWPMNLLFPLDKGPFACPKFKTDTLSLQNKRPKIIIVGDSFFQVIRDLNVIKDAFSEDSQFWYYFATTSYPLESGDGVPLNTLDIIKELETADAVILTGSIGTLERFPFGIDDYYINHSQNKTDAYLYE